MKKGIIFQAVIFTIVYGFGPGAVRLLYNQSFHGESVISIVVFYLNVIGTGFLNWLTIIFFGISSIDMKRKKYILMQLGQMIAPKKLTSYKDKKLLPTINLLDQTTLNSWLEIRKLAIDYGKKYYYRHEIFLPVIFLVALISLICCLGLVFFEISTDPKVMIELGKLQIFLGVNFLLLFYLFFNLLITAASINGQFDEHKKIMKKNKQIYNDLVFFKEFYFLEFMSQKSKNLTKTKKVFTYATGSLEKKKSTSYVHLRMAREIKDILGDEIDEHVEGYLTNILKVNESCLEELDDEQEFNSLTLLGFTIPQVLLQV